MEGPDNRLPDTGLLKSHVRDDLYRRSDRWRDRVRPVESVAPTNRVAQAWTDWRAAELSPVSAVATSFYDGDGGVLFSSEMLADHGPVRKYSRRRHRQKW